MSEEPPSRREAIDHLKEAAAELPGADRLARGADAVERQVERGLGALTESLGGRARLRVIALLAAVLAVAGADSGAISAVAPQLEHSFGIGNVQIGLLVTVSGLAAAVGMLPVGWVTDRANRTRLVTGAVAVWGVAEIVSATSPDYGFLLSVRLALGVLTAVTGPTLASLTGDFFPARERSKIYGYIITGELIGAGIGLSVAGLVSSWASWRVALAVLALPSFALAYALRRRLPEPARGGQSRLEPGAEVIVSAEEVLDGGAGVPGDVHVPARDDTKVVEEVRRRRIDPRRGVVLQRDPLQLGWPAALRYILAVPSNVMLIVSSALGYFFFGGVETFALVYLEGHYGVSQSVATFMALSVGVGAVIGAVSGGRLTDRLLDRGRIDARLTVPGASFLLAAAVFLPGILSTSIAASLPLFVLAGIFIGAPNPGLDAARLDVMPSRMWGRGEAVRSFLRSILQSSAPLLFGLVSTAFGGHDAGFGASSGGARRGGSATAAGLEPTFLVMLVTLVAAGLVVWAGRRRYVVDVAAADETERRFPATAEPPRAAGEVATAAGG